MHLRDSCNSLEKEQLQKLFHNDSKTEAEIAIIENLMAKYNTNECCLLIAQEYAERSKRTLKSIKDSEAKEAMIKLANYVVRRDR
jgi:geranylgeranyl diphosphate synthase type I